MSEVAHHYLFGYGSLISPESRQRTSQAGEAVPVRVRGVRRAWNVSAPAMKMTGVGIVLDEASYCNGVLVEVENSDMAAFDKREFEGSDFNYERKQIPSACVIGASGFVGAVWCYVVKNPTVASQEFPIVQSYVDVILTGCLELGEQFAIEFIRSTTGWEQPWYNDRNCPRYARSLNQISLQDQIDDLLAEYASAGFAQRKKL